MIWRTITTQLLQQVWDPAFCSFTQPMKWWEKEGKSPGLSTEGWVEWGGCDGDADLHGVSCKMHWSSQYLCTHLHHPPLMAAEGNWGCLLPHSPGDMMLLLIDSALLPWQIVKSVLLIYNYHCYHHMVQCWIWKNWLFLECVYSNWWIKYPLLP